MTLYEIVGILKQIALTQPNVKSATDGSIYDIMNATNSVKYDVVHLSQTKHITDEETDTYGFNIFYVSRLEDSLEDNRLQIQSIGKEVLDNILRTFCENWNIDYPEIIFYPFTQKFADLCAGVYCRVEIEVPKAIICADDYIAEVIPSDKNIKLQDVSVTITENGTRIVTPAAGFDGIGQITITTNVPGAGKMQDKDVEFDTNGEYTVRPDDGFDGLASAIVSVNVPSRYDEGYDDGEADQKAKLVVTSFTQNSAYTRADGWSAVTVNVPSDVHNQIKRNDLGRNDFQLVPGQAIGMSGNWYLANNGRYSADSGYTGLEVLEQEIILGVDDLIQSGATEQQSKLSAITINENGEYTRADGWSAVTVDVPQTGSSNADLIANLQGDYFVIPDGTTHLRQYCFDTACFSSITIPNSVSALGNYSFYMNSCLTSITIPDSVVEIGMSSFGYNTALKFATIGSGVTNMGNRVFTGCSSLTAITFEGLVPPTIDTGNTSGTFGNTGLTFPIYVPCQSLNAYKTAFGRYYSPRIRCKSSELITAITLNVADTITDSGTATTTYSPVTAYTDIYYTSSDTSKATINSGTGEITVVSGGSVTICTKDRLSGLQDCKTITVAKSQTAATAITISVPSTIYDSATATTTVAPSSATTNLQYSSNDTSKATINASTGAITVKASGTVEFCVTDTLSGLQSCKNANVRKKATSITINVPSAITDAATATTTVSPTGATTNLTYSSNNTSRATINSSTGAITVKSNGSVQFCVTDSISNLQSCKTVTVTKSPVPATSITINVPSTVTDSGTATVTVNPSSADTNITYTSSDTSIATVNNNGTITAVGNGTVTICANDSISSLQDCKTITVRKSATELHYTADTSMIISTGETRTITIDPTGFDANSFGLSISGATFTKSGNVYTITFPANSTSSEKSYTATLTATTYGGTNKSATINYTQDYQPVIVGSVTVIYNVTSSTNPTVITSTSLTPYFASITVGGNTYPIPTSNGNGFTIMQQGSGYPVLGYTFSATGKQSMTFNVASNSPLITGNTDEFSFLQSLYSTVYTDNLIQANAAVSVSVGSGIKYIPDAFFSDKCGYCGTLKISSVTISNSVISIGYRAFAGLHYLTGDVVVPSSVQNMDSQLFYWTNAGTNAQGQSVPAATFALKMVSSTPCTIKSDSFAVDANNYAMTNRIKVPLSAIDTYKNATNWSYYQNNMIGY